MWPANVSCAGGGRPGAGISSGTGGSVTTPGTAGRSGVLRHRESLARHTVWGIGGFADRYFEPADIDALAAFLAGLPEGEPLLWLGLGSNVLVRDGGVRGTVISTVRLRAVERIGPTGLQAQAGAACPRVARVAARHGLTGCEFLAGIPGSMGGALAMNAGAFGTETWPAVREVETIDASGERRWRTASDYRYGYRIVDGPAVSGSRPVVSFWSPIPGAWPGRASASFSPGAPRRSRPEFAVAARCSAIRPATTPDASSTPAG